MDILLILPNIYTSNRIPDYDPKEPLGLLYLISVLRDAGYSTALLNADFLGLSIDRTVDAALRFSPEIIGLSICERTVEVASSLVSALRCRGYNGDIIAGGFYPTLNPIEFFRYFPSINTIAIGESEDTIVDLLKTGIGQSNIPGTAFRSTEICINKPRSSIDNLDRLPFPARDWLLASYERIGYATIHSSRGCYGRCTFCSQRAFDRVRPGLTWRGRSATNVVDEIELLHRSYGVEVLKFNDDDIFGPGDAGKERVVEICNDLIRRRIKLHMMAYCRVTDIHPELLKLMKEAGFERVLLGIETTNPIALKKFNKYIPFPRTNRALRSLDEVGISVAHAFILFNPYSTFESIRADLEFLRKEQAYASSLSKCLKVHRGTDIEEQLDADEILVPQKSPGAYREYFVDREIAKLYAMSKLIWQSWIDPMSNFTRPYFAMLKNSVDFIHRSGWDTYLEKLWKIQADCIETFMMWLMSPEFPEEECVDFLRTIRSRIEELASWIVTAAYLKMATGDKALVTSEVIPYPELLTFWSENLASYSEQQGKIYQIGIDEQNITRALRNIYEDVKLATFTEKYRWNEE